jgi:GDP-L-fucose synthase
MFDLQSKIFVSGHTGMVGSSVVRLLQERGFENIIVRTRRELDLLNINDVTEFFSDIKPDYVVFAAAKVGGIQANISSPADFIYENLVIQNNIIHQAYKAGVKKLVFLGSSCIYPKDCPQPMKEEYLLSGKLEPTNEGYAIAKIAGLKMLDSYNRQYGFKSVSLMPCNLYGTNDSFHPQHAHVLSSLVRKFVDATDSDMADVEIWGTGKARREFMHVDDAAQSILYFLDNVELSNFINVGWGRDISIAELATMIAEECSYDGRIVWDDTKPEGMLKKCMDVSLMKSMGFEPTIDLRQGIKQTISEYKNLKIEKSL